MTSRTCRMLLAVAGIAALTMGAAFAVACGDDDDDDDGEATATRPAATTPTRPAGSPTSGATAAVTAGATGTAPAGTPAAGETTLNIGNSATLGQVITDAEGFTLYTFRNDTAGSGTSACTGGCVSNWPPATVTGEPKAASGITGEVGTITRPEGTTQVTYEGMPLYRFSGDAAPGETNGNGVAGLWDVATP